MESATQVPESVSTLESFNPATGELVGSVPTIAPEQVQAVVDDVARVQPAWAELPARTRATYMRRAADALLDEIDDLADLLVREQGKPRTEAYTMELLPTVDALHWCAKAGPKILADEKVRMGQAIVLSKSAHFSYEPIGVVGVIAPWNYPWSIPFGEVAIALMAGNGVVLKPASLTPLLGERIRQVFEKGGLPEGLVRVVHGGGPVGEALARSTVGKVFFTGSVEVGRHVGEVCAAELKGSVLELGGKDPMIVCADADLDHAVAGAIWGGFANAGQTCSGIERVYVLREVADRFVAGVARQAEGMRVGDPLEWETEIGPMTSPGQYGIVTELLDDAVAAGATRLCGGPTEVAACRGSSSPRRSSPTSPTRCGSCARRSSGRCCRSSSSTPSRRRSTSPTTPRSVSAPRSGPATASAASGSAGGCSRGWSGSTTTPSATASASARGAESRTPGWGARTRNSASMSASTSS